MSGTAKFREVLNMYTFSCVLPGTGEEIEFKPLTTGQLKKLLAYENEKNPLIQEQAIDDLIKSSVITEGFNVSNLYLEDRFFLLIQIKKKSKGEVIEFTHECEKCGSQTLSKIDLDSLPIIKRNPDEESIVDLGQGIKVKLRHVVRNDYKAIDPRRLKGLTPTQAGAESELYLHALAIEYIETEQYGIEKELSVEDRKYLLESIPTQGYDKIREWSQDNFFGIDFKYTISCIACGKEVNTEIPVESAFFL